MKKLLTTLFILGQITFTINAQSSLAKADQYYQTLNFSLAVENYQQAISKNKSVASNIQTCERIANSYFYLNQASAAVQWYDEVYKMQGDAMSESNFYRMISVLRSSGRNDIAENRLKSYLSSQPEKLKIISYQMSQLDSIDWEIDKLMNLEINTANSDFGPTWYNQEVLFTSSRSNELSKEIYPGNNQPYLNIYKATRNKNTGYLSNVSPFNIEMNSGFHDGTISFNSSQNNVYFSRNQLGKKQKLSLNNDRVSNLALLKRNLQNGEEKVLSFNNSNYSCSHPCVSADGKWLYFVSDMPGGAGQSDIFVCQIYEDGGESEPKPLGKYINTPGREMFPFVVGDTLFFASDGHYGFGGLDLYMVHLSAPDASNQIPLNLGKELNGISDDFGLIYESKERRGYFSSNRAGGKGDDDIYYFSFKETPQFLTYAGTVINERDRKPIPNAEIKVYDVFNKEISSFKSDDKGDFALVLPSDEHYKVVFSKENYSTETREIDAPKKSAIQDGNEVLLTNFNELIEKEGEMEKIKVDPIYFEYDKWGITAQAETELAKVLYAMEKFPNIKIKIESHTDARGSDLYNLKLSDNRAKSTMDYLLSQGIDPSRIESAIGYGETRLKNRCRNGVKCNEEEHFENRRSNFIIISK